MNIVCFVFKQKTAYEMRISDWSSDVCSSDLRQPPDQRQDAAQRGHVGRAHAIAGKLEMCKRNLLLGRKEDLCPDDAIRDPRDDRRNLPQFPDGNRAPVAYAQTEIGRASGRARVCQYV